MTGFQQSGHVTFSAGFSTQGTFDLRPRFQQTGHRGMYCEYAITPPWLSRFGTLLPNTLSLSARKPNLFLLKQSILYEI